MTNSGLGLVRILFAKPKTKNEHKAELTESECRRKNGLPTSTMIHGSIYSFGSLSSRPSYNGMASVMSSDNELMVMVGGLNPDHRLLLENVNNDISERNLRNRIHNERTRAALKIQKAWARWQLAEFLAMVLSVPESHDSPLGRLYPYGGVEYQLMKAEITGDLKIKIGNQFVVKEELVVDTSDEDSETALSDCSGSSNASNQVITILV